MGFRGLSGLWSRGKKQRAEESEHALMRMRKAHEITVGRKSEGVMIVPEFSAAILFVGAWKRTR